MLGQAKRLFLAVGVAALSFAAAWFSAVATDSPGDDRVTELRDQVLDAYRAGETIKARMLIPGAWRTLQVFGPLTPPADVESTLPAGTEEDPPIAEEVPPDRALLLATDGRRVVEAVQLPRADVDLSCLAGEGKLRPASTLRVVRTTKALGPTLPWWPCRRIRTPRPPVATWGGA